MSCLKAWLRKAAKDEAQERITYIATVVAAFSTREQMIIHINKTIIKLK